jgi:sterol desaturase/sphingolipid hydroxylase (fatty acid hydroxylase superfamily)
MGEGNTLWYLIGYIFLGLAVMYTIFAGFAYLFLYKWRGKFYWASKIQQYYPARKHIMREIWLSVSTLVIFGVVLLGVAWANYHGYTQAYHPADKYGYWYYAFSIVIMVFIHDAYFYWAHRLLHWKPLFKTVHIKHHLSINPTPFAALAFHPMEAVSEILVVPLVAFTIPHYPTAMQIVFIYSLLVNIGGHMGYETVPKEFVRHWIFKWHNTSTHHNMHHRLVKCNYGLYFNIWDRLMGTNHPDYEKHFEEVVDRRDKERLAKLNKKVWAKKNKQKTVKASAGSRAVQQG